MHFVVVRKRTQGIRKPPIDGPTPAKVFAYRKGDLEGIKDQIRYFPPQNIAVSPRLIMA
jgi:hypothetical protein